jgi:hypothetical protein
MKNTITDFVEDKENEIYKMNSFYFWFGLIVGMTLALIAASVVYFFK